MQIKITNQESTLKVGEVYDLDPVAAKNLIAKNQAVAVTVEKKQAKDDPKNK